MILGASSFAGSFCEISSEMQSVELYIPQLGVYKGSILQKDILSSVIDEISVFDLKTSVHAPYFADVCTYPSDMNVDIANMGDRDFRLINESIDIGAELGSKVIVIHPGRYGSDRHASFNSMVCNLRYLADQAEDSGVMLGLENKEGTSTGNMCCDARELVKVVDEVNSDNLGVTLDIGHANLTCGGNDIRLRGFVDFLSPYIVHVHVHDNNGMWTDRYDGDEHLAPGLGAIDYHVLQEIKGYRGIYNMEVFSMDDVCMGKRTIKQALNGL